MNSVTAESAENAELEKGVNALTEKVIGAAIEVHRVLRDAGTDVCSSEEEANRIVDQLQC